MLALRILGAVFAVNVGCALSFLARAGPPFFPPSRPNSTAAGFLSVGGCDWSPPVALVTMEAASRLMSSGPRLLDRFGIHRVSYI